MSALATSISKVIQERRSIFPKQFSGERVPDPIIGEMLENANWAPTHKKTEPWRFVVFCDSGIEKFAEFQAALYAKNSSKEVDAKKVAKLKKKPMMCSHIISIGMKRHQSIPELEEISAVAAAVQNMHLTAAAHGVGCYWSTGGATYEDGANSFFGLGEEDLLLGFLYVGMPIKEALYKGSRKPVNDKVRWVTS